VTIAGSDSVGRGAASAAEQQHRGAQRRKGLNVIGGIGAAGRMDAGDGELRA